jgi:hypothetical protein
MKTKRFISIIMAFAIMVSVVPAVNLSQPPEAFAPSSNFIITNPYAHVNWSTFSQFKAGLHNHTNQSDGFHTVTEMANRHYSLGYHIMSINEHNVITSSPDRTLTGVGEHSDNRGRAQVPLPPERISRMESGLASRTTGGGHGMIFVPYSNEPSNLSFDAIDAISGINSGHHINTYWTSTNRVHNEQISSLLTRMEAQSPDGIAIVNHAGRNTGALRDNVSDNEARRISGRPAIYQPYAEMFMNHSNLIGLEIVNKLDPETRADRLLWDNILKTTMPHGRPVWGSATDDAHHQRDVGFAYNLMLMPELSLGEFRRSLESGAFFAFSRTSQDPNYRIHPGRLEEWFWLGRELSSANAEAVHALPVPQISSITVNDNAGTISIAATGFDTIRWYADGAEIHRGPTLDLNTHAAAVSSYVRATVVSNNNGVLYVQPFGVQQGTPRALPTLTSTGAGAGGALPAITIPRIPEPPLRTEMGLRLPGGVRITTSAGTRPAAIRWQNMSEVNYNPLNPRCQTFTVTGNVFIDPNRTANPTNVPTAVSVRITVPCMPTGCECAACNECGTCRFCDPCLRCTGTCRQTCSHRNCTKIFHCGTCTFCTRAPVGHDYRWVAADGVYTGNHDFIRAFPIDLKDRFDDLRSVDSELRIAFTAPGSPSARRMLVWTDLTGEPNTAMVTQSNINASRVVRSDSSIAAGDTSVRLTIPRSMFYDSGSGQFATVIYVLATTNSTNFHEQPTAASQGIYRTDLTEIISNITVSVTGLPVYDGDDIIVIPPSLEITAVNTASGWIEIRNNTDELLTTRGMTLTNSADLRLWRLPATVVRPGGTLRITTVGSTADSLKWGRANFAVAGGQRVRLVNADRSVMSTFDAR